jgi:uncharacterized membrane protein YidH (DUF202 family)
MNIKDFLIWGRGSTDLDNYTFFSLFLHSFAIIGVCSSVFFLANIDFIYMLIFFCVSLVITELNYILNFKSLIDYCKIKKITLKETLHLKLNSFTLSFPIILFFMGIYASIVAVYSKFERIIYYSFELLKHTIEFFIQYGMIFTGLFVIILIILIYIIINYYLGKHMVRKNGKK